jgi:cytidylate kinase
VEREYAIGLASPLRPDQARRLSEGIELDEGLAHLGGLRRATAVEVARMEALAGRSSPPLTWYRAVLTQGWRRQLRRMFAAVEAPVRRLVRVRLGTLRLDGLRSGGLRPLTAEERHRLASADPPAPARPAEGTSDADRAVRRRITVALDGPGSSGKSSVGAAAAAAVGYRFCDTGVLYRGLAWLAHHRKVDPSDSAALVRLVAELHLVPDDAGRLARMVVDGRDVTGRLHSAAVDRLVSAVAADPAAREALLPVQRALTTGGGIVMAGRDIGSVVLPDADLRLYLDVSLDERAARRARQRGLDPASPDAAAIRADLARRDGLDSGRSVAPLRVPDGAVVIRGDGLELDQTVAEVVKAIRAAERRAGRREARS